MFAELSLFAYKSNITFQIFFYLFVYVFINKEVVSSQSFRRWRVQQFNTNDADSSGLDWCTYGHHHNRSYFEIYLQDKNEKVRDFNYRNRIFWQSYEFVERLKNIYIKVWMVWCIQCILHTEKIPALRFWSLLLLLLIIVILCFWRWDEQRLYVLLFFCVYL